MTRHDTAHVIQDTVLAVINDGDGSTCGLSYKKRCDLAAYGIFEYRAACQRYSIARVHAGERALTRQEIIHAASEIQAYYRQHVAETKRLEEGA